MLYNKIFEKKEQPELVDLLRNRNSLNYNAKKSLHEVIQSDDFFIKNYQNEIGELKSQIENEDASIASFSYLKYLGFKVIQDKASIKVTRLPLFYFIDVIGILIGALLSGMAYFALPKWLFMYENGVSVVPAVVAVTSSLVMLIGILLVVRSISRYFEFSGFEIVKNNSGLMIKKRSDVFVDSILVHDSKLGLLETDHELSLVYHNDQGEIVPIIKTRGGMRVRRTLVHLKNLLSGSY